MDQALALQPGDLVVIAPVMATADVLASPASLRARTVWLQAAALAGYNDLVDTLAVPFGPLFPGVGGGGACYRERCR